jgi:hypothetical protein
VLLCDRSALPGSRDSFVHSNPQSGVIYYYSAFAFDAEGLYSVAVSAWANTTQTSLGAIRLLPDNTSVKLGGAVVTAVFEQDGTIYVEDQDRSCGIRVVASGTGLVGGDRVDLSGKLSCITMSGQRSERAITESTVNWISSGDPLGPLALSCPSVGGAPVGSVVPGVVDGVGLNNIGLLVRITGRVTRRVSNYLWVDDGSEIPDILDRKGVMVRCLFDPGVSAGAMVSCTGVVEGSVPSDWPTNRRCVHTRSIQDITRHDE